MNKRNKKKQKKKKTISEMTGTRGTWGDINPSTRIIKNKKGKGSYKRKKVRKDDY